MRSSILMVTLWLVALLGCNKPASVTVEQAEKVTAIKPDWKLLTLHIAGFKKSKSGGT